MQSFSLSSCRKNFLLPSFGVSAGHLPQISLQLAGAQAFLTSAGEPPGLALVLMHCSQSLHHGLIFGFPALSLPSVQSTSVGSYGVKSGVSSGPDRLMPEASGSESASKDALDHILVQLEMDYNRSDRIVC